jgi:hypothetical protein
LSHKKGSYGSEKTNARDHGGANAPFGRRQKLADQGYSRTEFSGEAYSGYKAHDGVLKFVLYESVGKIAQGIKQDGHKKDPCAAESVAQDAPKNSSEHEAQHLYVDNDESAVKGIRYAQLLERGYPNDAEEQQVVDVYEVAECSDPDGGAGENPSVFRHLN